MSVSTKDAIKMAMEGNAKGFQETVNDLLMQRVQDAVAVKKMDVAASFMSADLEEEVEVETNDESLEEELLDEEVTPEVMSMVQKYMDSSDVARLKRYAADTRGLRPDEQRDKAKIIAVARGRAKAAKAGA